VKTREPFTVEFHAEAVARFSSLAKEVLNSVRSFGSVAPPNSGGAEIHPVAHISAADIIGEVEVRESSFNGLGVEVGRYWNSKGLRVGWEGPEFDAVKNLALRFGNATPIKGRVSDSFLIDEVFKWLRETLEQRRSDELHTYIAQRCSSEIKDYEIWVPVFRTYSAADFKIGSVDFRTVTKAMMDRCYERVPEDVASRPDVALTLSRQRSRIQGSLAACIRARAELKNAKQIAQSATDEAIGLLRFLSKVNLTCRLVSHCLPVGRENTLLAMELFVEDDAITSISNASIEQGPAGWSIDEARSYWPGILESLDRLASDRETTQFRSDLYGALQLHSRQSVAADIPQKMLFVVAAIESLLLKDSHEPIQKNLGERMAFLIGDSLPARKEIVRNVEDFYRIRSDFFHHGESVRAEETDVIDKFFFSVWFSLTRLLAQVDQYSTKEQLLASLDDIKFSGPTFASIQTPPGAPSKLCLGGDFDVHPSQM